MKHSFPRSPFATALSGSSKETELRIRNIFQWKKQRPPVCLVILVTLTILVCFHLVSCQPTEPSFPETSTIPLFTQPHGDGEFYVMEELPGEGQEANSETVAALYYRSPAYGETKLATLDYDPFLLAPCFNRVWQEDLDGDGQNGAAVKLPHHGLSGCVSADEQRVSHLYSAQRLCPAAPP